MDIHDLHERRNNPRKSWPYPAKQCEYRDCEVIIERPLYNQRWCGDCALEAKMEENRRRILSKSLPPDQVEARLDEIRARRHHLQSIPPIDGEVWRDMAGFGGRYQISTHGRVVSLIDPTPRLLAGRRNPRRGLEVQLATPDGRSIARSVHREMMLAFYPIHNARKHRVIHKNKDLFDNRLENLEWLPTWKIRSHNSKLNPDKVRHIRHLFFNEQKKQREIAALYQVNINSIKAITRGAHWAELEDVS